MNKNTDIEQSQRKQPEREQICEIGRRMYQKNFVAGHEGNMSVRIADNQILCTPTLRCKGFLKPKEICVVDLAGNPADGSAKPTSEIKLHLSIYRERPDVKAVVHSHAPHATAFAVAREPVPNCVLAEPDLFLGEIAIAPFQIPGSQQFADSILPFVKQTNAILLANHGVVTYGTSLEEAFWMTEILDATCRTLILAKLLGGPKRLTSEEGKLLAKARSNFGFNDPRPLDNASCDVCDHWLFKSSWDFAGVESRLLNEPGHGQPQPLSLDEATCQRIAKLLAEHTRP
jgi:L-fuculose-phosphate aldolase